MVEKKEDNNDLAFQVQQLDSSDSDDDQAKQEEMNTPDEQLLNMQK